MSRGILQDIIGHFSPDKFTRFFREKNRSFAPRQESFSHYNDECFTDGLKFGEIKFSESEKLITCAFEASQPLSERSGKRAQYEKGKRILKDTQSDAGIFVFYDRNGNFRFSLIYPEAVGNRRQWSNFRRFTYFVSDEFLNKTFLQRIGDGDFSTLEKIKDAFSVEKVTKEFYESYRKLFEALVSDLNKNNVFKIVASKNQINTADFAKKLLGQIVFLCFLQKKGWLGVPQDKSWGAGDKNFISNLYRKAVKKNENFYNDYLEILFYDTLNNARREGADPSFSKHFNCRIPFLNGGLFEPGYDWQGTKIYLDNGVFRNIFEVFDRYNFTVEEESPDDKEVAVDPEMLGKVFENLLEENLRKGKGTYYTPREIVHYMCRESLINHLVSESGFEESKIRTLILNHKADFSSKEAETLIRFLQEIKVCDPACGSGAFLVGMLNEIIGARHLLDSGISEYALKKETIQNCIYGVDIDPGAVEIAKLRLWLSLVVDYELADIEPLPNLDYKIMCGNSLLEELVVGDESIKLFDEKLITVRRNKKTDGLFDTSGENASFAGPRKEYLQKALLEKQSQLMKLHNTGQLTLEKRRKFDSEIAALDKELSPRIKRSKNHDAHPLLFQEKAGHYFSLLKELHKQYFTEYDPAKKKQKRSQIEDIELEFIKSAIQERVDEIDIRIKNLNMQNPEDRKKNAALIKKKLEYLAIPNEILLSKVRPYFLWHLNFFEVFQESGGFDVVIANPPYIKEYVYRNAFDGLRSSPYYQGKMDIWYLFACKGIDWLRGKGVLTFIAQNNWVTSYGASKMRNKVVKDARILNMIDFGDFKIFETAGIQTMIMMFKKDTSEGSYSFDFRRLQGDNLELRDILSILSKSDNCKAEYLNPQINRENLIDKKFTFSNSGIGSILEKILAKADFRLDPNKEVAQGIVCPQDYVNESSQEVLGEQFNVGDGIFTLSSDEIKAIGFSKRELTLIKPFYTTNELQKWNGNPVNEKWVIYTDSSFKDKKKIEGYPNIKKHLDQFKKVITSDNKPYGLHRARDERFFKGEKIIAVRKCVRPSFTYTDFDCYVSATFYVIKTERINQKYLAGLLNSSLIAFWLKQRGKMQGNNYQIDKEPIIDLPILEVSQVEQKRIIDIVEQIIKTIKSKNYSDTPEKQTKVIEYKRQIDQMVYRLYELTPVETEIIENSGVNKSEPVAVHELQRK